MIIGTIFFAVVAASALVLLVVIVKHGIEETRAVAHARPAAPSHHVVLPGEREERFTRQPDRRRAERRSVTVA
jgi:hypothetical protein